MHSEFANKGINMKALFRNIIFLVGLFIFINILTAQNITKQEKLEFYPHHTGDYWSYWWIYAPNPDWSECGNEKRIILKDTLVNDTSYWLIGFDLFGFEDYDNYYLERVDTLTGNVLRIDEYDPYQINCVDNVYADAGDTILIRNNMNLLYCDKLVVSSFHDTIIDYFPTTIRKVIGLPEKRSLFFARNIGMLGSGKNYWIDSAFVDGVGYHNISDVKKKNKPLISTFVLYQNYPNPFNPVTTIDYLLPKYAFVTIKIYDSLGRKIETLVSEEKLRGSYSYQFNGSNYASGIYFYQIRAGKEFISTKKMLLIK